MTKPSPEYENLTAEDLEWVDHCFDIGDQRASRPEDKNKP